MGHFVGVTLCLCDFVSVVEPVEAMHGCQHLWVISMRGEEGCYFDVDAEAAGRRLIPCQYLPTTWDAWHAWQLLPFR